MALANTKVYPVFGPAIIRVGTGANNALEDLGYTTDGVDIVESFHLTPIMTDVMGPELPAEMQKFGLSYRLVAPLAVVVPTVWEKLQKKMANVNTAGAMAGAGTLVFTNSLTVSCAVVSADTLEDPFYFPIAFMRTEANRRKVASKHNPLNVTIEASPLILATTTSVAGTVVMQRTVP